MSNRHEKEKGVNVQVLLRCRPFSEDEVRNNAPQVVTCNEYQREVCVSQSVAGKHCDRVFTFDKVFGPSSQQKDLYDLAVVPIVNEVLEGFNCTIFAYGQTGTGKTYTMEGECKRSKSGRIGELPAEAGVIPRSVKQIFDTLESQNAEYSVKVTFLELYNEEITDLLAPEELSKVSLDEKQKKQLPLMEDGKGGVLVRGLEEEIVTSANEIFTLLERGSAKRRTAETLLNKQSSRSHSLFSITIHIKEATPEGEELIKCGKLNLVDLAGSENISRSGAREGRAREAGEINKSLLTLGRVINALVEHLGHIPYRDSKLTRLLRDSLGGRTKTCIIATVSPAVHCLEETLSTLDYAHRAKNIKNKPEVNQKMMKSTLIKDLYGEIERLKAEVYAAREKNGVYIPKERFYQEEAEKKTMAEQIEQLSLNIENQQKQLEEWQERHDAQVQQCSELHSKLDATEKTLNQTTRRLCCTEEELKKCQFAIKEQNFVICEQKKSENALTQQACTLRSDLERAINDNELLLQRIGREDKLCYENRIVVSNFKTELTQQLGTLCNGVSSTLSQQNAHLDGVKQLCHSFLTFHDKSLKEMKERLETSRSLCFSHIEAMQNVVLLHKANTDASLEEISSQVVSHRKSIQDLMLSEESRAHSIFSDLQNCISSHQGELAAFATEMRQKFDFSSEETKKISFYMNEFLQKLLKTSTSLDNYALDAEEHQMKSIADFHKAYEEQSKFDSEKLAADITNLVSKHILRQKTLVDLSLINLRVNTATNKSCLREHATSIESITTDAKRKWQEFYTEAESCVKDAEHYSAAKHCRMESLLEQCVSKYKTAFKHWRDTLESVNEKEVQQESFVVSRTRNASNNAEQHVAEVSSAKVAADKELLSSSENLKQHMESTSNQEGQIISDIEKTVKEHQDIIQIFKDSHSEAASAIAQNAKETFQSRYMDYEATGSTPVRSETVIPSKAAIESLKALPTESLIKEFRESNTFESFEVKEIKPSLIPRSPLSQLN